MDTFTSYVHIKKQKYIFFYAFRRGHVPLRYGNTHLDKLISEYAEFFYFMLPKNDGGLSCVDTHVFGRREPPFQLRLV